MILQRAVVELPVVSARADTPCGGRRVWGQ